MENKQKKARVGPHNASARKESRLHPSKLAFGLIADQDEFSKEEGPDSGHQWCTCFKLMLLEYKGDLGVDSYEFSVVSEPKVCTTEGVGKPGKERGAEYSAIEWFKGKLLIMCDKTGNIDELVPRDPDNLLQTEYTRKPFLSKLMVGSGKKAKIEWSTLKGETMIIGSHGSTLSTDWLAQIGGVSHGISLDDGKMLYECLKQAAGVASDRGGYLTHEACRWSPEHGRYYFIPRKISIDEPFDEEKDQTRCANIMLSTPSLFPTAVEHIVCKQIPLEPGRRGCSDFLFIPHTGDRHILVLRTTEVDGKITSYLSVIHIDGNILMSERICGEGRKFEGATWIPHIPMGARENIRKRPSCSV